MCNKRQRGLTLIELLVFIVIIGIAANAMLAVFANLTRTSAGLLPDKQAQAIANGVMQEILARPFLSVTNPYTPNIMLSGNPALAAYPPANVTFPPWGIPSVSKHVVVIVTAPNGATARLDGIRFNY